MTQFTCWKCGGTFNQEWTDAEAQAEAAASFPGSDLTDAAPLCEPCDRAFMAWLRTYDPPVWRQAREARAAALDAWRKRRN